MSSTCNLQPRFMLCRIMHVSFEAHTISQLPLSLYTSTVNVTYNTGPSYPTVKLHHSILATALMKLGLKCLRTNSLTLWERSERKR